MENNAILLVEDEAVIAMATARLIEQHGYNVILAYTGEQAVSAVRENSNISLILMDIDLGRGKMDGTEAAKIILEGRDIPLVFLSSHTEPEVVEKTEKITSYGYVVKNSGGTVLLTSIKMAFKLFDAHRRIKQHQQDLELYIDILEDRRRVDRERNTYLLELYQRIDHSPKDLFDFAMDASLSITNSEFAFLGLINEDETIMTIHRWSKEAMDQCALSDIPIEFPIESAGVWGDCIREREPVIINEYETTPRKSKHGIPEGHVPIHRFLCIPVFDKNRIVAVGAVANKILPYEYTDVDSVKLLYDKMWNILERQKQEKKLEESEVRFKQLFNTMKEGVSIYQAVENGEDFTCVDLNTAGLLYADTKRDEVIGKRITDVYPHVKEIGLFAVLQQVYKTGQPQHFPLTRYKDERIEACFENYVFKLPSGLIVSIYEDTTDLHKEEERYKTIVQTTMDGFWLLDTSGNFIDVNDSYCRMSGYTRQELLTMTVLQLDTEESEEGFIKHLHTIMEEGSGLFERVHTRKDGTKFNVDISITYVSYGKAGQFITFIRDISERKHMESVLQENEQKFRSIFEESPIGKELYSAQGELIEINKSCLEIFGVTDIEQVKGFNLFNDPNVTGEYKDKLRNKEKIRYEVNFDFNKVRAADMYSTVKTNDIYLDVLITPLVEKKQNAVQGYLVQVVDITQQKQLENRLKEDKFRLSAIVEGTNVGTWEWNIQTGETRFNERWANIIGYTLEELSPISIETWGKYTHPRDLKKSKELLKKHFNGESAYYRCELRMKHRNGHWIWILDRGKVATWTEDGKPEWMYGTHQDINTQKLLNAELEESEQKWRSLVENNPDYIAIHDADGRFVYLNRYAEGFTENDVIGTSAYEYMPDESKELFRQKSKECLQTGQIQRFEHTALEKYGKYGFYENYIIPITEKGNQQHLIVTSRNITARKQAEEELKRSEEFLKAAGRIAKIGGWEVDARTLEVYWTEETYRIHGVPIGQPPSLSRAIAFFHPEDRQKLSDAVDSALRDGTPYNMDLRFITAQGKELWVHTICRPVIENNEVVKLVGTFQDISDKKQDELSKEMRAEMRNILENGTNIFYSHTPDHILTYVSPQVESILGYTPDEAMVKWTELTSDNPVNKIGFQHTVRAIETGEKQPPYNLELLKKTGEKIWVEIREFPIVENGKTAAIVGSVTDVTERKLAEDALKRSEEKYRLLVDSLQEGVGIVDIDENILFVNSTYAKIFGRSKDELIGMNLEDLMPADEYNKIREKTQLRQKGKSSEYETVINHVNGQRRILTVKAKPYQFPEIGDIATLGMIEDITERKRLEEDLNKSERKYEELFQNSLVSIWEEDISAVRSEIDRLKLEGVTDFKDYFTARPDMVAELAGQMQITDVNDITLELYGAETKEELFGSLHELIIPETLEILQKELVAIAEGKHTVKGETKGKTLRGDILDLLVQVSIPIEDSTDKMIVAITDITELKKNEKKLRASEQRFQNVMSIVNDGLWEWNLDTDESYFSPAYYTMLGYEPSEFPSTYTNWENLVHPDDLPGVMQEIDNRLKQGHFYYCDFRMRCKNGEWKWIQSRGKAIEFDSEGSPVRVTGTHVDLTPRKVIEERLENTIRLLNRNAEKMLILQEASRAVLERTDFNETAQILFTLAKEITGARSGYVALLSNDGQENEVLFLDDGGFPCTVNPDLPMPIRGLRAVAYHTGEAVVDNDFMSSDWVRFMPAGHVNLKNVLFAPLPLNGKVVGIIGLANKAEDFSPDDLSTAEVLGQIAAIALKNARTMELLKNREDELVQALEEKEYLIKEVHHRVKNNLAIISSLISLKQGEHIENSDFFDLKSQIDAIQLVHDQLHQTDDGSSIDFGVYVKKLINTIFGSFKAVPVRKDFLIENVTINTKTAIPLGLIINEIAVNAIKYGFTTDEAHVFSVSCTLGGKNDYVLTISNTGNPFPEYVDFHHAETLGLRLICALTDQIDGRIELKRTPHPVFTILFPK